MVVTDGVALTEALVEPSTSRRSSNSQEPGSQRRRFGESSCGPATWLQHMFVSSTSTTDFVCSSLAASSIHDSMALRIRECAADMQSSNISRKGQLQARQAGATPGEAASGGVVASQPAFVSTVPEAGRHPI